MTKTVTQKANTLDDGIKIMIDAMVEDYSVFNQHNKNEVVRNNMFDEYKNKFQITEGRKFIKISNDNYVKAFVVKLDFGKFKKGDVLKPATWRAPAMNSARGNVLNGNYNIQWTGPMYLK